MRRTLIALAVAAGATISLAEAGASAPRPSIPEARPVGEAVSCVNLREIRGTRVRDRHTIDFELTGDRLFRNTLPHACPGLRRDEAFSYRTSLSQLCNVDIITVLDSVGGRLQPVGSCGLGDFQPVELLDPPAAG